MGYASPTKPQLPMAEGKGGRDARPELIDRSVPPRGGVAPYEAVIYSTPSNYRAAYSPHLSLGSRMRFAGPGLRTGAGEPEPWGSREAYSSTPLVGGGVAWVFCGRYVCMCACARIRRNVMGLMYVPKNTHPGMREQRRRRGRRCTLSFLEIMPKYWTTVTWPSPV